MTKHRDVNKCRRQEKYKMAALISQANKRVRNIANKPNTKKKERMVKKKGKRERKQQQQHFLKRKRRQIMSASNGTKAGHT